MNSTFEILSNLLIAVVLLGFIAILSAVAGVGIGRAFTLESVFEEIRESIRFKRLFFVDAVTRSVEYLDGDTVKSVENFVDVTTRKGEILSFTEKEYWEKYHVDNRRIDIPRRKAFFLMKLGDMLLCPWCLSAQCAMWLALASVLATGMIVLSNTTVWFVYAILGLGLISFITVSAAASLSFIINDYANKRLDEAGQSSVPPMPHEHTTVQTAQQD